MNKYIILDVSTNCQLVILSTKKQIISINKNLLKQNFVSEMIPLISQILNKNNLKLKELKGIIVGVGPGSYIGSRLAVLTSKILSLELNIPLYQISSLLLLSSGYKQDIKTPKIYANKNCFYSLSLKKQKIILIENVYTKDFLNNFENHILLEGNNFKISPSNVFNHLKEVRQPSLFVPRYYIRS